MGLFRSETSSQKARCRPTLEALDARDVPAFIGHSLTNESLTLFFDYGNDEVTVSDRGGATNMSVVIRRNGSLDTAGTNRMTEVLGRNHVEHLTVTDLGGTNSFTYHAVTTQPVQSVTANGGGGRDTFLCMIPQGLAAGERLNIKGVAGSGDDNHRVEVGGVLAGGSWLNVDLQGEAGWDTVGVDAWGAAPWIQEGATLNAVVSGYRHNDLTNRSDGGNSVYFWALGEMDGRLQFNLMGSGNADVVAANLWLAEGSTGKVGAQRNPSLPAEWDFVALTTARVAGGDGADDLTYKVRGVGHGVYDGTLQSVDGGNGWDTLHVAQNTATGFQFDRYTSVDGLVYDNY